MASVITLLKKGHYRLVGVNKTTGFPIYSQDDYDQVFRCLFFNDPFIVKNAARALEKITGENPRYIHCHQREILNLMDISSDEDIKYHLIPLVPFLELTVADLGKAYDHLTKWALNSACPVKARCDAVKTLYILASQNPELLKDYYLTLSQIEREDIPVLTNKAKRLMKKLPVDTDF